MREVGRRGGDEERAGGGVGRGRECDRVVGGKRLVVEGDGEEREGDWGATGSAGEVVG